MLNKITAIPFLALNIDHLNLTVIIKAGSKAIIVGIQIKFMGIVIYALVKYNILIVCVRIYTFYVNRDLWLKP